MHHVHTVSIRIEIELDFIKNFIRLEKGTVVIYRFIKNVTALYYFLLNWSNPFSFTLINHSLKFGGQ